MPAMILRGRTAEAGQFRARVIGGVGVQALFECPRHPYTAGLLDSIPDSTRPRLRSIPGAVPSPQNLPAGLEMRFLLSQVTPSGESFFLPP